MNLWVVVPAYNEERLIEGCLDALAAQTDLDFTLVVVDNGSTDTTAHRVTQWLVANPDVRGHLVTEPVKGTGAAADTGFRYAISHGADWIGRTDADCLVDVGWVDAIKRGSGHGDMLGGRTKARDDEEPLGVIERISIPLAVTGARWFGRIRPSNRGPEYLGPYVMCVGNNLAVEAQTYVASGGFPRLAIEDLPIPNDRALVNRVRKISPRVKYAHDMIVYNSARRLRSYGMMRTLRWYADHSLDRDRFEVDIR